jgi:hypothetical protein
VCFVVFATLFQDLNPIMRMVHIYGSIRRSVLRCDDKVVPFVIYPTLTLSDIISSMARLNDELITTIAKAALGLDDIQTVGRLALLARRFPPLISPILYRRLTVKKHNFDLLTEKLLPTPGYEDDAVVAKKTLLRARVMAMEFEDLPAGRDIRGWIAGLNRCLNGYDVVAISNTALLQIGGTNQHHVQVSSRTIFPNLVAITVNSHFLEVLTMTLIARYSLASGLPQHPISQMFASMLTYGAVDINLHIDLNWTMTRARFLMEMQSRMHDGEGRSSNARLEGEAYQLFMDFNIDEMRSNVGLESLFAYQKHIRLVKFHSLWYNTSLPLKLRADSVALEFADYAGLPLADDYQPRPSCFARMSELHTALTAKIDWSIHNLSSGARNEVEEDVELGKVQGFLERLKFEDGQDPLCIWDHE